MWFKLEYEDYCCGSTYYESVPASKQPSIEDFKIERKRYIQPGSYTQKMESKSIKHTKEMDGQEWVSYESVKRLSSLPENHTKWINPVSKTLEDGSVFHQFLEVLEDWFLEINTIEEFIHLGGGILSTSGHDPYEINEIRISYKPSMDPYDSSLNPEPELIGYQPQESETV